MKRLHALGFMCVNLMIGFLMGLAWCNQSRLRGCIVSMASCPACPTASGAPVSPVRTASQPGTECKKERKDQEAATANLPGPKDLCSRLAVGTECKKERKDQEAATANL